MFHVIFVVSLVVFVVYWRKKNTLAKSLGDGYENDASFLQACKIKKYAGYICLGAVVLSAVTQGSQLIDDIKNLFGLICSITFFSFLYLWRKQSTAKKEAGENYSGDDRYLHFGKMKKVVGGACLATFVIMMIIPNSQEEVQKQAAIHAKYEAERAKKETEEKKKAVEGEIKKEVKWLVESSAKTLRKYNGSDYYVDYKIDKIEVISDKEAMVTFTTIEGKDKNHTKQNTNRTHYTKDDEGNWIPH